MVRIAFRRAALAVPVAAALFAAGCSNSSDSSPTVTAPSTNPTTEIFAGTAPTGGSDTHTNALNARAEPILRKEALRAGNAEIDVVTGATTTSLTWIEAVQSAMERAGRG